MALIFALGLSSCKTTSKAKQKDLEHTLSVNQVDGKFKVVCNLNQIHVNSDGSRNCTPVFDRKSDAYKACETLATGECGEIVNSEKWTFDRCENLFFKTLVGLSIKVMPDWDAELSKQSTSEANLVFCRHFGYKLNKFLVDNKSYQPFFKDKFIRVHTGDHPTEMDADNKLVLRLNQNFAESDLKKVVESTGIQPVVAETISTKANGAFVLKEGKYKVTRVRGAFCVDDIGVTNVSVDSPGEFTAMISFCNFTPSSYRFVNGLYDKSTLRIELLSNEKFSARAGAGPVEASLIK
ncbi:MAG: hypothetical protein NT027_14545 [Proteobacteria bacterium]|nr:hypothetical protein [Pseudomonadota bacterium]